MCEHIAIFSSEDSVDPYCVRFWSVRLAISKIMFILPLLLALHVSASSIEIAVWKTELNGARAEFRSTSFSFTDLRLYTKKLISEPGKLGDVFECQLRGQHLFVPQYPLPLRLMGLLENNKYWEHIYRSYNLQWETKTYFPYIYIFKVLSLEFGYLKCKDTLGMGLEAEGILDVPNGIVVKYAVPDLSSLASAVEGKHFVYFFPYVISVDPDTSNDAEILIRLVSHVDPDEETLIKAAKQTAEENSWTILYLRSLLFCLPEEKGNFSWPRTRYGRRVVPIDACVDDVGLPSPTRRCLGNPLEGAYWESIDSISVTSNCSKLDTSELEFSLNEIYGSNEDSILMNSFIVNLSSDLLRYGAAGVSFIVSKLKEKARLWMHPQTFLKVVDVILWSQKSDLAAAEATSCSSSVILDLIHLLFRESNKLPPYYGSQLGLIQLDTMQNINKILVSLNSNSTGPAVNDSMGHFGFNGDLYIYQMSNYTMSAVYYLLIKEDSLFKRMNRRTEVVRPIIGIGIANDFEETAPLTVSITFRKEKGDVREINCATWNPEFEEEWSSPSSLCSKGKWTDGSILMDLCVCTFVPDGITYVTRMIKDEPDLYNGSSNKPRLELISTEESPDIFLNVYNGQGLGNTDGMLSHLKCTLKEYPFVANVIGLDPTRSLPLLRHEGLSASSLISNTTILQVQYTGEGNISCSDKLGLGLHSNQITITKKRVAVVLFEAAPNIELTTFRDVYLRNFVQKFRMGIYLQDFDKASGKLVFRFVRSFSNVSRDFYEDVQELAKTIANEYQLTILSVRGTLFCPFEEKEGLQWPITDLGNPAVPVQPCVNEEGIPSPTRHCIGNYVDGAYWDPAPKRPILCLNISERASDIKIIAGQEDKMEAIDKISIEVPDGASLEPYEVWTISNLLKDAANEVSEKNATLKNITSLATLVNSLLISGKNTLMKTDNATGSSQSVRESIEILLATTASQETSIVSMSHFSALTAPLESGVRGFFQEKSSPSGEVVHRLDNVSIVDVVKKSPKIAAYFEGIDVHRGSIVSTVFQENWLFDDPRGNKSAAGPVLGMTVFSEDGKEYNQPLSLVMFFPKRRDNSSKGTCQHWVPDLREWSHVGCQVMEDYVRDIPDMVACVCTHITFYQLIYPYSLSNEKIVKMKGAAVLSEKVPSPVHTPGKSYLPPKNVSILDPEDNSFEVRSNALERHEENLFIMSVLCCLISLCSLLVVLILAISKPEFREGEHRKVHLHITTAQVLFIGCFLILSAHGRPSISTPVVMCIPMGIVLHYSVLSTFAWSFIAAFLLTLKFSHKTSGTEVRGQAEEIGTKHIIRAAIIAWGLPFAIVIVVLFAGKYERRGGSAICLPENEAFYASVLFPISVICLLNLAAFIKIYLSMSARIKELKEQFRLALMYFVFLGLQWVLGIAMNFTSECALLVLAYLFTVTATLQGLSMMVLFVFHDYLSESQSYELKMDPEAEMKCLPQTN